MLRDEKLDFWFRKHLNVLFIGAHGVGKTTRVNACFERHGLVLGKSYLYFSAATLDPWVDLVGVPKESVASRVPPEFSIIRELAKLSKGHASRWVQKNWRLDEDDANEIVDHALERVEGDPYLELVRPKALSTGEVEAVFFDEFNRSHKKVRNAVMELMQYKSINGKPFPNLKAVWAAVNPVTEDDQYDVEKIDWAQEDRFHVKVELPYEVSLTYFQNKYGKEVGDAAVQWWNEMPADHKKLVSPRRLDYAIGIWKEQGDLRDVLQVQTNPQKLLDYLGYETVCERLEEFFTNNQTVEARTYLSREDRYDAAMYQILQKRTWMRFFLPLVAPEKLTALIANNKEALRHVCKRSDEVLVFANVLGDIVEAKTDKKLAGDILHSRPAQLGGAYARRRIQEKRAKDPLNAAPVRKPQPPKTTVILDSLNSLINDDDEDEVKQFTKGLEDEVKQFTKGFKDVARQALGEQHGHPSNRNKEEDELDL